MTSHPAGAFLVSLLNSPSATLTLVPQPTRRQAWCAFYDEPLPLLLTLRLAPNALPAPKQASSTQHALPLGTLQAGLTLNDDDQDEDEESPLSAPQPTPLRVPTALHILLAHTRAVAEAAYVSPGGASGGGAIQAPSFWRSEWAGNHTPRITEKGMVRYQVREARWLVEWNVKVPIVYQRTPHPTPSLSLRATLTLTVNAHRLAVLLPIRDGPSLSATTLYRHDLLSPLSEGPSYPDESAAERAARSEGHLARLSASSLPAAVLGAHLVTPYSGAQALARRKAEETSGRKEELDLGAAAGRARERERQEVGETQSVSAQRSASLSLDVKSAINVRMRTVAAPCVPQRSHEQDEQEEEEDTRALVLCVELENAPSSGLTFALEAARIQVSGTPTPMASLEGASHPFPLHVKPGAQHNLLYYVYFTPAALAAFAASRLPYGPASRAVSIILTGAPLGIEAFESSWNCTLDMTALLDASGAQADAALGAGGVSFSHEGFTPAPVVPPTAGSVRLAPSSLARAAADAAAAAQEAIMNAPTPPTLSLAPRRGTLPSQRALPPLPRTPTSAFSTPRPGGASPLPTPTPATPRSSSLSSAYFPPPRPTGLGTRTPSGGVGLGLLAQARARAGSAAYPSVPYSARPSVSGGSAGEGAVQAGSPAPASVTRPASAGPASLGWAALSSAPLSAWNRVTGGSVSTPLGGAGSPASAVATHAPSAGLQTPARGLGSTSFPRPGERDGMPQRAEVRPWSTTQPPGKEEMGLLVTASVREQEQEGEKQVRGIKPLETVHLEMVISNRSVQVRGAVLAWEDQVGLLTGGASGKENEDRALDAEAAVLKHLALRTAQDRSAVLPLTTDVRVGPLAPGSTARITLPLLALGSGTHALPPLCLIDVDTGIERVLRDLGNVVVVA